MKVVWMLLGLWLWSVFIFSRPEILLGGSSVVNEEIVGCAGEQAGGCGARRTPEKGLSQLWRES